MTYIYLAEPIDQAINMRYWTLHNLLANAGFNFYAPKTAWSWQGDMTAEIQQVNDVALKAAGAVLAAIRHGIPSYGVPIEIERAFHAGVPVVVLADFPREQSGIFAAMNCVWTMEPAEAVNQLKALLRTKHARVIEDEEPVLLGRWQPAAIDGPRGSAPYSGGYTGDAGYDLTSVETMTVPVNEARSVPCGIHVQLPDGYWALIQGRSSSWRRGLSVKASVIDAGYRGPLWVDVLNISRYNRVVKAGERIAQLIPMPLCPPITWVESPLDPSSRGSNGYGSTGV